MMTCIYDGWRPKSFELTPTTYNTIGSERKFGVELEFSDVPESYVDLQDNTVFGAKSDPSVEGGEFDSPILFGDAGLKECESFCDQAIDMDFLVDSTAGYHLHLDMRDESLEGLKRIALGYHYTKKFWYSVIPDHRRHHEYTSSHAYRRHDVLSWKTDEHVNRFCSGYERYTWVNWLAYRSHKSLELRCHEGTPNGKDVTNWIMAHTRFADAMSDMKIGQITRTFKVSHTVDQLFKEMRAIFGDPDISSHMASRYRKFA